MAQNNPVLQLLITAKDEASALFGKIFGYLDDNTKVISGKIREAFTGVFGGALTGAADLEAQLDRVAAKGGYTASEVTDLKKAAQQLGAQFGISGVEAAQGMESLAAAGLTAKEAIATLPQVLALAASEQISADAAATKLIDSLSIMGLGFEEAGRMADVLSKGADITTSSASQLAEALSEAGGTARAAGMDLEYTVAALDLLHKNGIKGSEAGTALKSILTSLLDPASKASTELNALGISSRDLGTVLAELKSRGGAASTAILAFGTEAGPGLRALINEGQAGLNDYTAQLKDAEGAAANAAANMGGNLKAALASLSSAWESLRTALLDPLLEPITKQVKELAGAFQEGLSSDKFKAVQDTIKAFGEASAQAIGDFIRSFDFQGALRAVADFAIGAKDHFATLSSAGEKAASVVVIAWNGVTAGVKTIGAAMAEITASVVATLANIEEAASKVGLGSVERATALRQKALEMQTTAIGLLQSVQTDAGEMQAAFNKLTTQADQTTTAINNLKAAAAVPPDALVLEPLIRSLEDYKVALDRAKVAQEQAAKTASDAEMAYLLAGLAMDNGTGSVYRFEEASRANQAAQEALKVATQNVTQASSDHTLAMQEALRGIDAESKAVTASVKTKQQQIEESQRAIVVAKAYADAQEGLADAQLAGMRAEIALAEAKGNTAEAQRLSRDLAIKEAEVSARVAQAKWAEQQAEAALALKKLEQLNAIKDKNAEQKVALELALLAAQREVAEAEAAGINAEAQTRLAEKIRVLNGAKGETTEQTRQTTEAVEENTEKTEKNTEAGEQSLKTSQSLATTVASLIQYWREHTKALSDATLALFEYTAGFSDVDPRILATGIGKLSDEAITAGTKISQLGGFINELNRQMLFSANSVGWYMDMINRSGAIAEKSYYEQKLAAEQLEDQIKNVGVAGVTAFGTTNAAAKSLTQNVEKSISSFYLLNDQDLEQLRSAMDSANDKLRQMQEETQSARDRLAELNAEILEERGMDQQAALLRQQIDYQQQLAEIEKQRADAQASGNRALVTILTEQENKLRTLNDLKVQNIKADAETESQTDRTIIRVSALADEAERAGQALSGLAGLSLNPTLVQQSADLAKNFNSLNGAL